MPFDSAELNKFAAAGNAIATSVGTTFENWAMGEAAIICKQWMAHTPIADPAKVLLGSRSRATRKARISTLTAFNMTANTGRRGGKIGRIWRRTANGKFQIVGDVDDAGAFSPENKHYNGRTWSAINRNASNYGSILPGIIKASQGAIGLARQSILQIADSLGMAMDAAGGGGVSFNNEELGKIRSAKASDGRFHLNGYSIKSKSNNNFSVTLVNRYPRIQESRIDVALEEVVNQRMAYQESTLGLLMEQDAKKLQQAYPYLSIK
jgi:hypothetical protein